MNFLNAINSDCQHGCNIVGGDKKKIGSQALNLLEPELFFFLILAQSVYKI